MDFAQFDNTYARLPERFFASVKPHPVSQPKLLKLNEELAQELGLDPGALASPDGLSVLAGNRLAAGSEPLAMAYAGQQFGNWSPQLGDGRAHLLGEIITPAGARRDIQLKGSGPTPFSRNGDGRAWVGPVLREYIVSEAMHALGVPTTRALAAVATGDSIQRENVLPGAILTRVARSHLRVGTFQYFAIRRDVEGLKTLADYAIDRLYPQCVDEKNPYLAFLGEVVKAQAKLVASWMGLGFIHGVMNTDNVSISGETIDYGPCAFMDGFNSKRVFSSIDELGRYAFANQPAIAHWNLAQFAQALLPLFDDDEELAVSAAQEAINVFPDFYQGEWAVVSKAKLGLTEASDEEARSLMNDLLGLMEQGEVDFTQAFRFLSFKEVGAFRNLFDGSEEVNDWIVRWNKALGDRSATERSDAMLEVNPAIIPRNHRVEQTIRAALDGDIAPFERLVEATRNPFDPGLDEDELAQPPQPKEQVLYTFCGT
ncbi:MAG: YdiU family protein [Pseudomonadota bacterium]